MRQQLFARYIVINSLARLVSALRSILFLYVFGLTNELGQVLYVIALVGQALVFGSIYDLIACKWSYEGENEKRLRKLAIGFFGLSGSTYILLAAISSSSQLGLTAEIHFQSILVLTSMFLFGCEITRARSSGKNIDVAYGQAIVALAFIALFLLMLTLTEEEAILAAMSVANLFGWVWLRRKRILNRSTEDLGQETGQKRPSLSSRMPDFLKSCSIYIAFSLLHTADKLAGSRLVSTGELAAYLMAFSFLAMLRASMNFEQYFAARLGASDAKSKIAQTTTVIVSACTCLLLVGENIITTVIDTIGQLDPSQADAFAKSFRTLILAWPVLTLISVMNRSNLAEITMPRIMTGTALAFSIWLIPISNEASSPTILALSFAVSTVIFLGTVFFTYRSIFVSKHTFSIFFSISFAYVYSFADTPLALDLLTLGVLALCIWRVFIKRFKSLSFS